MQIIRIYDKLKQPESLNDDKEQILNLLKKVLYYLDDRFISKPKLKRLYEAAYEEFYAMQEVRYIKQRDYIPYFISRNQREAERNR